MKPATVGWASAGMLAVLLLASLGWGLAHPAQKPVASVVGRPAPQLAIRTLDDGRELNLTDLRGTPVVLNFWASWCVPCRQEAPVLAAAARRHQGQVQFLGADIQDSDTAARAYEAEIQSPYPVGPIIRGSYGAWGVTAPPETFFIDRRGVIAGRILGPVGSHLMDVYLGVITGNG